MTEAILSADDGGAGLHFKNGDNELTLSDRAVFRVLDSFDRFLVWASDHPILFESVLALVALGLILGYYGKRKDAAMKIEYEAERTKSAVPELPFPKQERGVLSKGKHNV